MGVGLRFRTLEGNSRVKQLKETLVKLPLVRAWVESSSSRNPTRTRVWVAYEILRRLFLRRSRRCDVVLLSYPRSGNHLVRFVIESCSQRPTLGHHDHEKWLIARSLRDDPIFLRMDEVKIKNFRPIVLKRHNLDIKCEKLVFLTRHPVTSILSELGREKVELDKKVLDAHFAFFLRNLTAFLDFDKSRRLLITLEAIEADPINELSKLLKFLGVLGFEENLAKVALNLAIAKSVLQREARPDLAASYPELLPVSHQYLSTKFRAVSQILGSAGLDYKF